MILRFFLGCQPLLLIKLLSFFVFFQPGNKPVRGKKEIVKPDLFCEPWKKKRKEDSGKKSGQDLDKGDLKTDLLEQGPDCGKNKGMKEIDLKAVPAKPSQEPAFSEKTDMPKTEIQTQGKAKACHCINNETVIQENFPVPEKDWEQDP